MRGKVAKMLNRYAEVFWNDLQKEIEFHTPPIKEWNRRRYAAEPGNRKRWIKRFFRMLSGPARVAWLKKVKRRMDALKEFTSRGRSEGTKA